MNLSVFGIPVYPYGIFCALAMLAMVIGLCFSCSDKGTAGRFSVLLLLCGGLGARLLYCLVNAMDYIEGFENGALMLRFFDGGFSMTGLLLGCIAACWLQSRLSRESFAKTMDRMVKPLPLAIALLRLGECFTDLGVGKIVEENALAKTIPWLFLQSRMGKAVVYYLNVRVYEAVAAVLIFVVLLFAAKRFGTYHGRLAALLFILYGGTQIFFESLRDDGHMKIIFLRVAQVGAAGMLLWSFSRMLRKACAVGRLGLGDSVLRWLIILLGIGLAVAVEFSLDGRLTVGKPTALRDYLVLAAVCAALIAVAVRTLTDSCHDACKGA